MATRRILKEKSTTARSVDPNWSRWMRMVRELPDIRADKVRRARRAVSDSTIDAEDKLNAAIDKLANDLQRLSDGDTENNPPDAAGV